MKKCFTFAVLVLSGLACVVQGSIISECTSTRYSYMGGSVAPVGKDYMLVGDMDVSSWWGYAWLTFETPDAVVSSAFLNIQSIAQTPGMWGIPESSPVSISVYAVNANVSGIGSTHNAGDFRSLIGDAVATVSVSGGDTIYSWDITQLVNSWAAGAANDGLVIGIDSDQDLTTYARFAGIGSAAGINPVITDAAMGIPEPATMLLLGVGALAANYRRR